MVLVDRTTPTPATEPLIRALPDPATRSAPPNSERMPRRQSWQVWVSHHAPRNVPVGVRTVSLRDSRSSRWRPVDGAAAAARRPCPRRPPRPVRPAPGSEIDDVSACRSPPACARRPSRVALVAQQARSVSSVRAMSLRVQPDRRLATVGHIRERRPELVNHLGALSLAPGQRHRRRASERSAQPISLRVEAFAPNYSSSAPRRLR